MNSKKAYYGLLGLICLLVIGSVAALFLGNSMLQNKSTKLVDLKLENKVLEEQQSALIRANKDIEKYAELENITKAIVPQDKDQAKSVREIIKIAQESGISIASISFPTSTLGTPTVKPSGGSGSGDSSNSGSSQQSQSTPAAPPVSQVKAVDGISGVYQLEITIQSEPTKPVSYSNLIFFLTRLEQNRRTAQVSQINISPNPDDIRFLTFNLTINVFIKP